MYIIEIRSYQIKKQEFVDEDEGFFHFFYIFFTILNLIPSLLRKMLFVFLPRTTMYVCMYV